MRRFKEEKLTKMWRANKKGDKNIEEIKINNSERPVDALAEKGELLTHLLTTWNQEMLAHLKIPNLPIF